MPGFALFLKDLSSFVYSLAQRIRNADVDTIQKTAILFVSYFFTAQIGLSVNPVSGFATFFWMPTGISLAFLVLYGKKFWPAVFLGALLANLANGATPPVALGIAVGNTMEALLGFYLLNRFGFSPRLERLRDTLILISLAGFIATLASATIGVESLLLGGMLTVSFSETWLTWWIGNVLSNLIVAPFVMTWGSRGEISFEWRRIIEVILISILVIFVGLIIFTGAAGIFFKNAPFGYLVFPPLIWIALRFGQKENTTAIFVLSIIAILTTVRGLGPFAPDRTGGSLIFLQTYMATVAITFLVLAASSAERKRLEKIKDEFIGVATHELKTPLTSMKAYTQIIYKKLLDLEDRTTADLVAKMEGQINKLSHLINDLLDVSKIQEGKLKLEETYFDVNEMVEETVSEIEPISESHDITVDLDKTRIIKADRNRIEQVLTNLITNAIKYSPSNSKIIITTKLKKGKVIVCVKDFGVGIDEYSLQRIFEKHFRGGEDRLTYPGMGLGLYIVKEIIERHGGDIWVKSKRGKGSTFCFSLS